MVRLLVFILFLLLITFIPFLVWGERIEQLFTADGVKDIIRSWGSWGWIAGIMLIISDVALPIPASGIMATMGIIYGPILGGLISFAGSVGAGLTGYGVCRLVPVAASEKLAGSEKYIWIANLFDRWGGWLVVASRWLPVLPETVSFLAGLARMPFGKFLLALVCGSLPLAFAYAAVGHLGADQPLLTILVAAIFPLLLWLAVKPWVSRWSAGDG